MPTSSLSDKKTYQYQSHTTDVILSIFICMLIKSIMFCCLIAFYKLHVEVLLCYAAFYFCIDVLVVVFTNLDEKFKFIARMLA